MQQTEEKNTKQPLAPTEPISEPLTPLAPDAVQPADDEEDSPDAIFFRAVAQMPTQPLDRSFTPQFELERKIQRECAFTLFLVIFSLFATVIVHVINQPVVTITLLPVHKSVQLTTIPLETRTLAPVTLTRTGTAPTTGKGHQDARPATGSRTFYNGLFTPQTIPIGTVFTGADGVKVVTDECVTIPSGNPPSYGQATVSANTINPGAAGNIAADDLDLAVSSDLLVRNLVAFTGGLDARDYKTVAKTDLDTLTSKLQQRLTQAMPQAFSIAPGEEVTPTNCTYTESADHGLGEKAQTVTVKARKTCSAIVYNQNALQQQVTSVFNATRPGKNYELVSGVRTTVVSVTPFLVLLSGQWEYVFTSDDEQYLAQHLQGETPAQARAYLLKTGLVSHVTITRTQSLPDWYHIQFLILIGV